MTLMLVGLCLVGIQGLEAQGTAKPFTNRRMESAEEYARIIGNNDSTVLYIDADEIAAAAEQAIGFRLSGYAAMSEWLRQLEMKPCPAGEAQLARILTKPTKKVDVRGWRRPFHEGENCLYADNRPVISLSCGNFIPEVFPTRSREPDPAVTLDSTRLDLVDSARADWGDILVRLASTRDTVVIENQIYLPAAQNGPSWWSRNWEWVAGGVAIAGGLCAWKCRLNVYQGPPR